MMELTAKIVKAFRDQTGLELMECKKLLNEADNDFDEALKLFNLRKNR